jgi:hypothetical protein
MSQTLPRSARSTARAYGHWVAVIALVACTNEQPDEPPPLITETDDSPVETDEPQVLEGERPLCREAAPRPVIPAEFLTWYDTMLNSANRFYGEDELDALNALGDDLGPTPEQRARNGIQRGWSRLKADDVDGAIADFQAAEAAAIEGAVQWRGRARELLGAAWMRKAETVNCINSGGADACIVPFNEGGYHADPTGMENAAAALERSLTDDDPDGLSARWLLNVTYMARGLWPEVVPAHLLLPEAMFASEAEAPAWRNHAPSLKMFESTGAGGAAIEDFDGDGLLDVLFSSMEPDVGMELWLNEGGGTFCNASRASGLAAVSGVLNFTTADYDNDGDMDLFGARGAWMALYGTIRPSLLRNDGEGRFTDVTVAAGMSHPDADGPTQVAAWADYDGDGWVDLFVGREDDERTSVGRRVSSLYRNRGDGTFVDEARAAGVASAGFVKGASWGDLDGDGHPDLVVSNMRGPNRLYINQGDGTFIDRAERRGFVDPLKSFPTALLDYNQDGRLDIFVAAFTNNYGGGGPLEPGYFESAESYLNDKMGIPADPLFSESAHLYRNDGDSFTDVTELVGLDDLHATMGLSFGDFNMDGYPDLLLATGAPEYDALEPNVAYLNDGGRRFLDVTTAMRVGHLQKGHGVAFGDVDEDGDEDMLMQMGGVFLGDRAPNTFFVNPSNDGATTHHAITLRLEGVRSNRSAIGAVVEVRTPARSFWAMVGGTGSFGQNSMQLEIGLADQAEVSAIVVQWPGGALETITTDIPLDHLHHLREGEGIVSSRPLAPFQVYWTDTPDHSGHRP